MDHIDEFVTPAHPVADIDPDEQLWYYGLSKMDYAMVHISAALAATGRFDLKNDAGVSELQNEAYAVAAAALSVSPNL